MTTPFYEKDIEIEINYSGLLPHWNQYGKIQFVTFRLTDSLPQSKIKELSELRQQFLSVNPLPWNDTVENEYWKLVSPFESKLLDNGYGSCILKIPAIRKILSDSMKYFDGSKYQLLAYVIMPNHVHALFQLYERNTIESVMHSIKSYSSKVINKKTGRTGSVWMKEYFDRIVRSERHLNSCVNYILGNPRFLRENEYEVYVNHLFFDGRQDAATP